MKSTFGVGALFFGLVVNYGQALNCYDTSMKSESCEAIDLWCIKYINGSTITRGCANVYEYCTDEDPGCYPELEANGVTQKWCCCNKDLCNSTAHFSTVAYVLLMISLLIFI